MQSKLTLVRYARTRSTRLFDPYFSFSTALHSLERGRRRRTPERFCDEIFFSTKEYSLIRAKIQLSSTIRLDRPTSL